MIYVGALTHNVKFPVGFVRAGVTHMVFGFIVRGGTDGGYCVNYAGTVHFERGWVLPAPKIIEVNND